MIFERNIIKEIPINIWDDNKDGSDKINANVIEPEETYAYVEAGELSPKYQKKALDLVAEFMKANNIDATVVKVKKTVELDGVGWRWEVKILGMSQEKRRNIVAALKRAKLVIDDGTPLNIYSES